jgi:hypothetical protein
MSARSRLKAALGTAWAVLAIPIILTTFIGMNGLAPRLVASTGLTINPRYTGGKVVRIIDRGAFRTRIHQPVFAALIGQGRTGFVQVDFVRADSSGALPATIDESVDFDGDGSTDFRVIAVTESGSANITGMNPRVLGRSEVIRLDDGLAVRAALGRAR